MSQKQTWIWALDPLNADSPSLAAMAQWMRTLKGEREIRVIPVSVASPDYLNWPQEFSDLWTEAFNETIRKAMTRALSDITAPILEAPVVVSASAHSKREAALAFVRFAQAQNAEMIFMMTHSRKGLDRLMLGSFTESVIALSPIPVMTMHPNQTAPSSARHVLFPSDLAGDSYPSFERVIALAKDLGARLTLFHRFTPPVDPVREAGLVLSGGAYLSVDQFLVDNENLKRAEAQDWIRRAEKAGVAAAAFFARGGYSLAESIHAAATSTGAELIALEVHAGPAFSGFFTNVPREIVRDADCPVLVFRQP